MNIQQNTIDKHFLPIALLFSGLIITFISSLDLLIHVDEVVLKNEIIAKLILIGFGTSWILSGLGTIIYFGAYKNKYNITSTNELGLVRFFKDLLSRTYILISLSIAFGLMAIILYEFDFLGDNQGNKNVSFNGAFYEYIFGLILLIVAIILIYTYYYQGVTTNEKAKKLLNSIENQQIQNQVLENQRGLLIKCFTCGTVLKNTGNPETQLGFSCKSCHLTLCVNCRKNLNKPCIRCGCDKWINMIS